MNTQRPIPLRPDPTALRSAAAMSFTRAATASLLSLAGGKTEAAVKIVQRAWPGDRDAGLITKAASSPATITDPSWAGPLSIAQHANLVSTLAPSSVAAALLGRCLRLEWPVGVSSLSVPSIAVSPTKTPWVGEGSPVAVTNYTTSLSTPLTPKKVASIALFTREILQQSLPNAEVLVRTAISESLGLALDAALFSTAASTATAAGGIFNGIAALPASAATIPSEAMVDDISRVVGAVSTVSGNAPIGLVMSPRQAASMKTRVDVQWAEVFSSTAMPDGSIAAIATNALASIGDLVPTFTTSIDAVLHEDTAPSPVGTAAPARSIYQTDAVALKLTCSLNWTLRSSFGAAWISGVAW
jgi:hypothetical protein